jgi:uncharacterized membrane protein
LGCAQTSRPAGGLQWRVLGGGGWFIVLWAVLWVVWLLALLVLMWRQIVALPYLPLHRSSILSRQHFTNT